jgi:hypothetical protein
MYLRGVGQTGRRQGFGQVDPNAVDPSTGFTYAQEQVLCAGSATSTWDSTTGTCVSGQTPQGTSSLGPAANNCANNTKPGTSGDVNCPFWCFALPDFMWPASCWPCSNICPTGTNFDTTNNVCSANPVTTNCIQGGAPVAPGTNPATAASGCPSYCTLPFTSSLAACAPCAGANPSSNNNGLLFAGAAVVVAVVLLGFIKK